MKLIKTTILAAVSILGIADAALAQNTNLDTNGRIPYFIQGGASGFSQNQVNLDTAYGNGVYGPTGVITSFYNNPVVYDSLVFGNGSLHYEYPSGYVTGSASLVSPTLIAQYNTSMNIHNMIYGDGIKYNPTTAQSAAVYQQFLNQLSPGIYTALPSILFNSANVQNTQIQQRLWVLRDNSSNGQEDAAVPNTGKSVTATDKKVTAPTTTSSSDKKWVTFADGNGMWSQGQGVNNIPSYNTYAGGAQVGASYELFKGFNVGPYVGYQGTKVNFNGNNSGGSSATDNSVRFGLFGEYQKGGWYTDGIVGGAYNNIAVNHGISIAGNGYSFNNLAKGTVSGGEFDSLLGTGYEFKAAGFTFGPSTSLQYTYLNLGSTQETGGSSLLDQNIGSQNTSSLLYTLGGQFHYDVSLTHTVKLQPFASLSWQHEFLQNGYNVNSSIMGQSYTYGTTSPGRDQYIAAVGANLAITKNIGTYLVANFINGDNGVFSQAVSAGINLKF